MRYNVIMPLKPIDYSKTIMYRIYSDSCDFVYVGHTINTTKRKAQHKHGCTLETSSNYNFPIYKQIRENGGWDNFIFAEIEEYPCENAVQARIREQYWIQHFEANLNSHKAYQSLEEKKEQQKQWYEDNKEHIKEQRKQRYESNKEKMTCECGSVMCVGEKRSHAKTKKHIQYLESL